MGVCPASRVVGAVFLVGLDEQTETRDVAAGQRTEALQPGARGICLVAAAGTGPRQEKERCVLVGGWVCGVVDAAPSVVLVASCRAQHVERPAGGVEDP